MWQANGSVVGTSWAPLPLTMVCATTAQKKQPRWARGCDRLASSTTSSAWTGTGQSTAASRRCAVPDGIEHCLRLPWALHWHQTNNTNANTNTSSSTSTNTDGDSVMSDSSRGLGLTSLTSPTPSDATNTNTNASTNTNANARVTSSKPGSKSNPRPVVNTNDSTGLVRLYARTHTATNTVPQHAATATPAPPSSTHPSRTLRPRRKGNFGAENTAPAFASMGDSGGYICGHDVAQDLGCLASLPLQRKRACSPVRLAPLRTKRATSPGACPGSPPVHIATPNHINDCSASSIHSAAAGASPTQYSPTSVVLDNTGFGPSTSTVPNAAPSIGPNTGASIGPTAPNTASSTAPHTASNTALHTASSTAPHTASSTAPNTAPSTGASLHQQQSLESEFGAGQVQQRSHRRLSQTSSHDDDAGDEGDGRSQFCLSQGSPSTQQLLKSPQTHRDQHRSKSDPHNCHRKRVRIANVRITEFFLTQGRDTLPDKGGPSLALGTPVCGTERCPGCASCTTSVSQSEEAGECHQVDGVNDVGMDCVRHQGPVASGQEQGSSVHGAAASDERNSGKPQAMNLAAASQAGHRGGRQQRQEHQRHTVRRRHPTRDPAQRLERLPPSDRTLRLQAEGATIDEEVLRENATIWREYRGSRKFCGCASACRPKSCGCSARGVECWIDADCKFGCGCAASSACHNPAGRYSFSQAAVNLHRRKQLFDAGCTVPAATTTPASSAAARTSRPGPAVTTVTAATTRTRSRRTGSSAPLSVVPATTLDVASSARSCRTTAPRPTRTAPGNSRPKP
eukprot:m.352622 g.352622  ORF g.352622 m.352622 type:complete len:796 (-) comp19903_c9_seq5:27-2414(-)